MAKAAVALAAVALAVGGYGAWAAMAAQENARRVEASLNARPEPAGDLPERLQSLEKEVETLRGALAEARSAAAGLSSRVEAAEASLAAAAAAPAAGSQAGAGAKPPVAAKGRLDPALRREWEELVEKTMGDGNATAEEQERFWKLVKSPGFADNLLAELEAAVAADPKDIDARMELSVGYVTKLFTVPPGPEMGTWAAKAEGEWTAIIALDDKHWDARNALATSYSRYPEFLNKTADAISGFEAVRRLQEGELAPEAKQAQVYTNLATLYLRQGNKAKAREALEAGSRRHPDDETIRKTLGTLGE